MRTRALIVGLMVSLAVAACGSPAQDGDGVATAQSGAATTSPAPSAKADEDPALTFARCMRENGMSWFPDPDAEGRTVVKTPKGLDPAKFEAAQEACSHLAPDGGDPQRADPEMVELGRQMAKCMRENGIPDFPDPQPNGSIQLDRGKLGTGPGQPKFDQAQEKCSQFMPEGRSERKEGSA
ncbi:hypothetical protein [Actinoplanes sp. M2I2]|uniref:hypothetical protein n=1 Tax=Actinoplanes sp. M2I2 TaxID=1734444 RepID=UPI002021B407|nr:hypothetical protein [Actinoplanes sp. M2I2]